MSRPIQWFRLYRGRVWHVYPGNPNKWDVAFCGQGNTADAEETTGQTPRGGKPCPECVAVATAIVEAALEARAVRAAALMPFPDDDVVDAEIMDDDDDPDEGLGLPDVVREALARVQSMREALIELPGVEVQ